MISFPTTAVKRLPAVEGATFAPSITTSILKKRIVELLTEAAQPPAYMLLAPVLYGTALLNAKSRIKQLKSGNFSLSYSDTDYLAKMFKIDAFRRTDIGNPVRQKDDIVGYMDSGRRIDIGDYMDYLVEQGICVAG
jgi:hypothetical protein